MKTLYYSSATVVLLFILLTSCSKSGTVTPPQSTGITVSTFAGNGTAGLLNGTGTATEFDQPSGLAINNGKLYVGDFQNQVVREINLSNASVTTFAGTGTAGSSNGSLTTAEFGGISDIAFDNSGNMLLSEQSNNDIREITPAGQVSTIAGNGTSGYKNGSGSSVEFNMPGNLVTDANRNIYVTDNFNQVIRKITATGVVSTYAGNGTPALANGGLLSAAFYGPYGMAMDASGNLYVADADNNVIRKVDVASGQVTTFAGSGKQGLTNGAAATAAFFIPAGLAFDNSGNLYVSETGNNTIRKITPGGVVSTYAGTGAAGSANGAATAATFNRPISMVFDSDDNLYVADTGNNEIRKILSH